MRTITEKIYRFDELSPAARDRAWADNMCMFDFISSDYEKTLCEFEKAFDISVYNYRVGDNMYNPMFKYLTVGRADDASEINNPLRLARYMWNNFADDIKRGKYYSTPGKWIDGKYHYKYRRSNCTFEYDNLTGFCADYDIMQPVVNCLFYKEFYNTFDELINECLTRFFRAWDADIEYHYSYENFAELCEIHDIEFYETGARYHG